MILDKYKVESEPDRFALFVVKETGGKTIYFFKTLILFKLSVNR
jgi:hypothetical protein